MDKMPYDLILDDADKIEDANLRRAFLRGAMATCERNGQQALDLELIRKALAIGYASWAGDGWYAKEAGYDYDDAEATFEAAQQELTRHGAAG